MKRTCGCRDDTLEIKKNLLRLINSNRITDDNKTINIGIYFHICYFNYNTSDIENDVVHTIDLLNKDFSKQCSNFDYGANKYVDADLKATYNSYVTLADVCNIKFYKVGIKYAPITSQTSSNISILDNNVKKNSPPVEPNRYLNLWIVDFNNGLLGYAQFPWDNSPRTDGVVISKGTFGKNPSYDKYNLGKTLTHEIGHWLGLYHTFQDTFAYSGGNIDYQDGTPDEEIEELKGDCVADTPPQGVPTYGNPFETPSTWPTSKPADQSKKFRHMFMNFMDYSDDIALFMFTQDQKIKMRQLIYMFRPDVLKNNSSDTPQTLPDPNIPQPNNPTTKINSYYDFDSKITNDWINGLVLLNNNNFEIISQVISMNAFNGKYCLRTRKQGKAELKLNMTGSTKGFLKLYIKAENPNTYVWVKPATSKVWYSSKIAISNFYKQYTFTLPGSFDSLNNEHYSFRFGCEGTNNKYSYFDNINVSNFEESASKAIYQEFILNK